MVALLGGAAALAASAAPAVASASPTLVTTPKPAAVTLGARLPTLKDSAVLAGGSSPTGTITFTLVSSGGSTPLDIETVTVDGNGTYTTPAGFTLPASGGITGTYQWDAVYSGDANNNAVSDTGNPSEQVVVSPARPTLTTTPHPAALTLGPKPRTLTDSAVLAGGSSPTGTITFTLFVNGGSTPVDTETLIVDGNNGTYSTPVGFTLPATGAVTGTYQWDAVYSGDENNNAASDTGSPRERVVVAKVDGFGGFLSPSPGSALKLGSTINVRFRLTNSAGRPIARAVAAKLAAAHDVTVTLTGRGIKRRSVSCTWNRAHRFFQCNITTPKGVRAGRANPYRITALENGGAGFALVLAAHGATTPNPETVFFKKRH
jgi:hypothetical protein